MDLNVMRKLLLFIFASFLVLTLLAGGGIAYLWWAYGRDLPDYRQLADYAPPVATRLYAGDGRLMAEYAIEKRVFVPIQAVPQNVIDAVLSAEDKNFYRHKGIDLRGLIRAVLTNVRNLGANRRLVGASTITQQVAKNFLLTNEKSFARKIKEAILTLRIERAFSKDRILELYLNENNLGFGAYGVAAAAMNYFNKSLDQLTIAEAAYLGALLKAPNNYHPVRMREAAVERRNWVIERMQINGFISPEEAKEAQQEELTIRSRDTTQYVRGGAYFSEEIRRELASAFGSDALYKGGLAVRASMEPALQQFADEAVFKGLTDYDRRHGWRGPVSRIKEMKNWTQSLAASPPPSGLPDGWYPAVVLSAEKDAVIGFADATTGTIPYDDLKWAAPRLDKQTRGATPKKASDVLNPGDVILVEGTRTEQSVRYFALRQMPDVNGALVAMDPHTGRILAMSGGFSMEQSEFNRATQAVRQPGSAFKPFVYLSALENGYTPSTIILDAPFAYQQATDKPLWTPKNLGGSFGGPSTLRVGLEKSRNLMTVRLANAVGMNKIAATADVFGINDHLPRVLASALGAGETTPLRLTAAYAMLANGGKRITPTLIDRVQDRNGKTIYKHDARACTGCSGDDVFWTDQNVPEIPDMRDQIADPRSVYQIVHIMEGVVLYGSGRQAASLGVPMAGKTGTSNDSFDAWFVGFTPDLVVGVFVGFDQPRTLGAREFGSTAALPIFTSFMRQALKGQSIRPFPIPPGIQLVRVNHQTGLLAEPGDKNAIYEAFKTGTFPSATHREIIDDMTILPLDAEGAFLPSTTEEGYPQFMMEQDVLPPQGTRLPDLLPSRGARGAPAPPPQAGGLY